MALAPAVFFRPRRLHDAVVTAAAADSPVDARLQAFWRRVRHLHGRRVAAAFALRALLLAAGPTLVAIWWWPARWPAAVAAAALFVAGAALLYFPGWIGARAQHWQFMLGIGMACAVTALPILILFMEKLAILRQPLGQRILRYASLDDLAVWAVLALILLDWDRVGRQLLFLIGFAVIGFGFRRLMRKVPEADRWYLALIWLALVGFAADWSGLHFMVGAFLAGAIMDSHWFHQERMDLLRSHVLLVLMPVFFLSTGLRTQWQVGGAAVFLAAGALLLVSVSGKLAGVHLAGRILGWPAGQASVIGWLLQTKALIMIIFANVLLDKAIISNETFTALLIMAVLSTMLTVPMVTPRLRRV